MIGGWPDWSAAGGIVDMVAGARQGEREADGLKRLGIQRLQAGRSLRELDGCLDGCLVETSVSTLEAVGGIRSVMAEYVPR